MPPFDQPFSPGAKVAAYLRDSGHEDQELSVAQQEAEIRAWCIRNNLILSNLFIDDAAPGSSVAGRDQFVRMISYFRGRAPEAGIIIWKFSRFARDIDDAQFFKADLRRRGYVIYSLNDPVPDGLNGRFFEAAIDWMNSRYLEDLSTDVIRGQRHVLNQYGVIGGRPPRGFKTEQIKIGVRRDGRPHYGQRWVPDPEQIELVQRVWQMRASGMSYTEINAETSLYKSINCYPTFFSNRLYLGELHFGDQVILDYCEPIISKSLWDTVQAINKAHSLHITSKGKIDRQHPRRDRSSFFLSGLVHCAQCGSPLNGEIVQFKSTSKYRYQYYSCTGQNRHNGCTAKMIPQEILENAVLQTLEGFILAPENLAVRNEIYNQDIEEQVRTQKERITALKRELAGIEKKIDHLINAIEESGHTTALLERLTAQEGEKTRVLTDLNRVRIDPTIKKVDLDQVNGLADRLRDRIENEGPAAIRRILTGLIDRINAERRDDLGIVRGEIVYFYPPAEAPVEVTSDPNNFMPMSGIPPGASKIKQIRYCIYNYCQVNCLFIFLRRREF